MVDLDAAFGNGSNEQVIRRIVAAAQVPVQVAGGIRSSDAHERGGSTSAPSASCSGPAAALDPDLLWDLTSNKEFDRVVVALDVAGNGQVRVKGWTESAGPLEEVAKGFVSPGVVRFAVTAIERDGTLRGPRPAPAHQGHGPHRSGR